MPPAHSLPASAGRRTFLAQSLAAAGMLATSPWSTVLAAPLELVSNVTQLYPVRVARVLRPGNLNDVISAVEQWPGKIAIGGGRYSMGGQVAIAGGLHLDMRSLNRMVWLRPESRTVRVQAGMCWRDLQDLLDPLSLAVKTMQSYANFTVGGSVSVNAHGRYVGHGPVGNTVRALQLVLADGRVVEASPTENIDLFKASIGGYGAVGIITEVELDLAENVRIERSVRSIALADYADFFAREILNDPRCVLHNADLMPPRFDVARTVTWRTTDKELTETGRLVERDRSYAMQQPVIWAVTELPGGNALRRNVLWPMQHGKKSVKWLNLEASLDVAELEPLSRRLSSYVLQEYFIPRAGFMDFTHGLKDTLRRHRVNAVNVSLRHSPADTVSLLPWAATEVFSLVLYHKQGTSEEDCAAVGEWTRELIDLALAQGGRHYLPYQLHATPEQFAQAYPSAPALRALKQRVDPTGRLSNELWAKYL